MESERQEHFSPSSTGSYWYPSSAKWPCWNLTEQQNENYDYFLPWWELNRGKKHVAQQLHTLCGRDRGGCVRTGIHQILKTWTWLSTQGGLRWSHAEHLPSSAHTNALFSFRVACDGCRQPLKDFFFLQGEQMLGHLSIQIHWHQGDKTTHKQQAISSWSWNMAYKHIVKT